MEIPKLVNLETKEEYEAAFRYMWNWIADETIKREDIVSKCEFFEEHLFDYTLFTVKDAPLNYCYMCEYTKCISTKYDIVPNCKKCPVKWGGCMDEVSNKRECTRTGAEYDLWYNASDWQSASVYARAIANLPLKDE